METTTHGLYRPEFEHDACGIGALAQLKGERSHAMLDDALSVLVNLEHRGGKGLERNTGDGAGILFQVPHRFFRKEAQKCGHLLPDEGDYGVAMLFMPQDPDGVAVARRIFEEGCAEMGLPMLFWREVPIDAHDLGTTARSCMPTILQAFVGRPDDVPAGQDFERRLYVCRRTIEKRADAEPALTDKIFYVCSMSARTIVYKGMLVATQMRRFFRDLNDAAVETSIALVHSRYSTNTTPSWERAHPNRYIIHNGEINTLKGNVNWIRAREPNLYSPVLGSDLERVMPIINREGSDSAILDNVLEFLTMNGRDLARAVTMLIPEPWDHNKDLSEKRRAYDAYQSMLMEPWDGPAAIAFTDGHTMGAALDRNGLRPARYYVTRDDRLILSSEVGTIDVDPDDVLRTGCLGPGEMLLVDPDQGRVIWNDEIRDTFANEKPYHDWLGDETLDIHDLSEPTDQPAPRDKGISLTRRMAKLGYHWDDVDEVIRPMASTGKAPLASMGQDMSLACLSLHARSFFDYFNELFAQVTNPPIDALRESLVTSSVLYLGNHGNLLEDARDTCRLVRLQGPILSKDAFERICAVDRAGFKTVRVSAVYRRAAGKDALKAALNALNREVEAAVRDGANIIVISDRAAEGEVPIPSLLAVGSVHNHLIRRGLRMFADLVVECGDAISPHDYATLVGYSASGIYPYMAHECIADLVDRGELNMSVDDAISAYDKGITTGIISIMSKMGISAIQGYHSAQIFEIVGFSQELVDTCFTATTSRIGGLGLSDIQREENQRYDEAMDLASTPAPDQLASSGITKWRPLGGEEHLIDPRTIYLLQHACQEGSYQTFKEYSAYVHRPGRAILLRDLLDFVPTRDPIPLEDVEPASEIVKRFNTGAMSYGSISKEAHECLAIAMNRLHGRSNTGEGGEDPVRETPLPNGDSKRSAIKQVASGRFGVTSRYLASADEIQIKMAQGAKPGEGGHLPGKKVYPWIATVRQSTPGVGLISPPPHHDIYSIEDLAELIFDLKNANPGARISVKLVAEAGVGTIATGVAKGGADKILISGHNGGTGAAPRDAIYHAGLPLELGLAEAQQTLLLNGLRSRVVVEADGKLMCGRDVAVAALLGAEEYGFATCPIIAMGCLMQRDCQQDTCPAGIATQNCRLRGHFAGKPEYVTNFMTYVAEELREIMASLGFATVDDMVGHPECLRQVGCEGNWKADLLDLSPVLVNGTNEFGREIPGAEGRHFLPSMAFDPELDRTLDSTLFIPYTADARDHMKPIRFHADVANVNRCVGTMLGSVVTKAHPEGLPEGSVTIDCDGSGGQSFGAFLPAGITLNVSGDANDYFGKGLSGGILSVRPAEGTTFKYDENVIIGNVAFYGATSGRGFANGLAGQRFAVRNSGATLVVEGCGNHGCEYMTGGVAVVLGEVGLNFAAGMSGGVAYVYDRFGTLESRCNHDMVDLMDPTDEDLDLIHDLIAEHVARTQSPRGIKLLYRFDVLKGLFVKVIPRDYRKVLSLVAKAERSGHTHDEAESIAFESMRRGM
ncbi:MAG: glutamate synthase large subunit [Atopobiaceae bacterium]|nr:glutamate synthase large subunit [Atopobiaceae bacterium]MCH4179801.1 glutamate synthase large subunit [Atopobiaceae bacterium]MCH4213552.1 glutamate synthase large subunit [Atopobiaceae bacterium]MCH4229638.1 glutamate synthase large subunit [Atopobiaceae bacterium]MCH4276200.1 glutamate synthase large subunit [Atopobiaceae bacterium]